LRKRNTGKDSKQQGEASIYVLNGDLAGIITICRWRNFATQRDAYSERRMQGIELAESQVETLIDSHPMIEYK